MTKSKVFRFLSAFIFGLIGTVMVMGVGLEPVGVVSQVISSLGFAFIISGISTIFRDLVILKPETDETSETTARKTVELLQSQPINPKGLKMIIAKRRGYDGYYNWLTVTSPQELFFAGRAVLHRIQNDLDNRNLGTVEKILLRKLEEGGNITILFLDPRSDIIDRLALEEGQSKKQLLSDIAFSLGVCARLYKTIDRRRWRPPTELHIRVYDEVPYFAYHKEDNKAIVGFYYAKSVGSTSAAFEVQDLETLKFFQSHFDIICDRAQKTNILEISTRQPVIDFNRAFYAQLYNSLVQNLGKRATDGLVSGKMLLNSANKKAKNKHGAKPKTLE